MLRPEQLHEYQRTAVDHLLEHRHAMLFLDMGLGKTIAALTALVELMDRLQVYGALVLAPRRVIEAVWRQEAAKWEHTKGLSFGLLRGSPRHRAGVLARRHDVYLCNYEALPWLANELHAQYLDRGRHLPFNLVIYDEVSKMKATRCRQGALRGQHMLRLLPFIERRIGLTGTPASNGLLDLFGQYLVTDSGQRLGTSFTAFQERWFHPVDRNGYRWAPFPQTEAEITEAIGDITVTMSNDDYLDLPPYIWNDIWIDMPAAVRPAYDEMERNMFVELASGHRVDINSAGSLVNRSLQYANGAIYRSPDDPTRAWEQVHTAKLRALDEVIEEAAGQQLLIAYEFQHDAERIIGEYSDAKWINSRMPEADFHATLAAWESGKLQLLIGHPGSMGHGLDRLQNAGHQIVWFGLNWSLDLFLQTCARLRRQGQTKPVIVHRLLMRNTIEEAQCAALAAKAVDEQAIRTAIENYRQRRAA